jgi:hypothetical protein
MLNEVSDPSLTFSFATLRRLAPSTVLKSPPMKKVSASVPGMITSTASPRSGSKFGSITPVVASNAARYAWSYVAPPLLVAFATWVKVPPMTTLSPNCQIELT